MRMTRVLALAFGLSSLVFQALPQSAFAWSEGFTVSLPVITKDPENLHGINAGLWYDPETLIWRQFHLYFDVLGAHYWVTGPSTPYHDINILAVSPVVRYLFKEHFSVTPYLEFSVGPSYLSNTRFANRNMGMHFSFQDRGGLGLTMGKKQQFALGVHIVHYSNASLSSHNSGITIPLMIDASYKFV